MTKSARKYIVGLAIIVCVSFLAVYIYITRIQNTKTPDVNLNINEEKLTIPAYPGTKLISTSTDPKEGLTYNGIRFSASWSSKDSVDKVMDWYLKDLQQKGWVLEISPDGTVADIKLATLHNDKYTLNVSVFKNKDDGLTKIALEYGTKRSDIFEPGEEVEK